MTVVFFQFVKVRLQRKKASPMYGLRCLSLFGPVELRA